MNFAALLQLVAASAALVAPAAAHPGGHHHISARELARRQVAAEARHNVARNCGSQIRRFQAERKAKRMAMVKRTPQKGPQEQPQQVQPGRPGNNGQHPGGPISPSSGTTSSAIVVTSSSALSEVVSQVATASVSAAAPYHTAIDDYTCVTAPEVTEGPYYINNGIVRTDLREDQEGVTLVIDIGVIDVDTCTPLSNAFVELWNANATGVYGGYPATLSGGGGDAPPGGAPSRSATVPTTSMALPSGNNSAAAAPTGGAGAPSGGMSSTPLVRNETFLRGGYYTNDAGIVEITTLYAGYYAGRTPHVHTMVHVDWEQAENGTLISHAGTIAHIGQFFYNEAWNDQVFELYPYNTNTNERTYNDEDSILAEENADGNSAFVDLELLGENIEDGLLGWVTMGVSASASYSITSTNYLNSTGA